MRSNAFRNAVLSLSSHETCPCVSKKNKIKLDNVDNMNGFKLGVN